MLDGFLLLYSCRVKIPSHAIKSNLSGQNIVDVREEDLVFFTNLLCLDISDNNVMMSQLLNLSNLEELDMQYNNMTSITLPEHPFPRLCSLKLSFNKISPSHIIELSKLKNLQKLEIASNDLCTLPSDLSGFVSLVELSLASNGLTSNGILVDPGKIFYSLSTIPNLRSLNLSRNKFKKFHNELLQINQNHLPFEKLEELNFGFNLVDSQESLFYCA
jgi:Leucine-rich repeat (LRR) protein